MITDSQGREVKEGSCIKVLNIPPDLPLSYQKLVGKRFVVQQVISAIYGIHYAFIFIGDEKRYVLKPSEYMVVANDFNSLLEKG